jgi:hypothetical protein
MASTEPDDRFEEEEEVCSVCGAIVGSGSDRGFRFGTGNALCWDCAASRGGRYDAGRDAWDPAPDLTGVPDEAYGASPHEIRKKRR